MEKTRFTQHFKRTIFVRDFTLTLIILVILSFVGLPTRSYAQTCTLKSQGDTDCNGRIDLIDYEGWRREFLTLVTTKTADFNGDSRVDLLDYESWRRGFLNGTTNPTTTPVPGTGYVIPLPANYPLKNSKGAYFTTLGVPDDVARWRNANHLWNKPLPANTPKSPNSAQQIDVFNRIIRQLPQSNGTPALPYKSAFNKGEPYVYMVDSDRENFIPVSHICHIFEVSQPYDINAIYPGKNGIPLPAEAKMGFAVPGDGGDHQTVIYDYKKDIYFDFWDFFTPNVSGTGGVTACLGLGTSNFVAGDGMGHPGTMNAGMPRAGTLITLDEAYRMKIPHVIAIQTHQERGDQPSYPATQFIGQYNCYPGSTIANSIGGADNCLFDGQRIRLPANYDTSRISHPFARAVAEAIKTYGIIVTDYAACNCLTIEGERPSTEAFGNPDPWLPVFGGLTNGEVYEQIPWQDMEVLPQNWGKP